jgi:hypothetical protein
MIPVVEPPPPAPRATPPFIDLASIAGPSRVVRDEVEDDGGEVVFGFATGDEIAMDLD